MIKITFYLLALVFSFNYLASSAIADPNPTNFIKSSCKATRYPNLCIHCLSIYANKIQQNEHQLAQAALAITLTKARSTIIFVSKLAKSSDSKKPRDYQAVKDCIETMSDTVDQLSRSIKEMSRVGGGRVAGQEFMWHMSNVQTWVSAALTNENTCLDGFSGVVMDGNVKAVIRKRVVYVAQVTSNALALVNRFASRHRS